MLVALPTTFAQFSQQNGYTLAELLLNPDMIGPLVESYCALANDGDIIVPDHPKPERPASLGKPPLQWEPGMVCTIAGKKYQCLRVSPAGAYVAPLDAEVRTIKSQSINAEGEIVESVVKFNKPGAGILVSLSAPGAYRVELGVDRQSHRPVVSINKREASNGYSSSRKEGTMSAEPMTKRTPPPPAPRARMKVAPPPPPEPKTPARVNLAKEAGSVTKDGKRMLNGRHVSTFNTRPRVTEGGDMKPCLCGCGILVPDYFKRGHIARFNGQLLKIKRGEGKPEKIMNPKVAAALGPWKKKGKGLVPSKGYTSLRD